MKSKKLFRYLGILLALAIVVLIIGKKKGWFGNEVTIQVAVEEGVSRDLIEIITANGKIQPETEVRLSPDVSGEIVELAIKEGDIVKKGDFLLKIKPDNYISMKNRSEATLNSTKARLTQASAQLNQAELEHKRKSKLWEQKAISEAEFEQSLTTLNTAIAEKEAAQFSVASANASLTEAVENLRKTSIYAPMDGTVSMLIVELGERVVGTEMMSGTELLRIADLSRMEVEVEVNENDIVSVQLYDTALVEVDAYLGRKFKGIVTEIPISAATAGLATDQVTNFNVKILLLASDYSDLVSPTNPNPFRPGMSATADIQTSHQYDVFSIPIQSVTTRPDTAKVKDYMAGETKKEEEESDAKEELIVAFVVVEDTVFMKIVETGIQDDRFIEITSGLEKGDQVVVAPFSAISKKLEDKSLVEVVKFEDLFKDDKKKKSDK
ncbi:MAG: efflux RND transporter periplasmic adaptor subunit [Bacteroidales bacterium]|nr:efflux RND transporter periplasmic adaptor subunit [Bacteroidales bacterium]MCF8391954.1 efflux RND transporter periplasmic adaptor subunit [Bacteroidales bacterium]